MYTYTYIEILSTAPCAVRLYPHPIGRGLRGILLNREPNHNGTLNKANITKYKTLIGYWKAKAIADEWVRVSELNPYKTLAEVIREL